MARILGTPDRDVLEGTAFDDLIRGFGEGDTLFGRQGNDRLNGGTERDFLWGNLGDDTLIGAAGDDELNGGAGADRLFGGDGNDTIAGGLVNDENGSSWGYWDQIWGGAGDDRIDCFNGAAWGGDGNDRIFSLFFEATYSIQTGDAGADTFAFGLATADGFMGIGHVTDFTPADGDKIGLGIDGPIDGEIPQGTEAAFDLLDTNDNGLIDDGDSHAWAAGNRLWLTLGDDVIAIDFTGGQTPVLQLDWLLA